MKLDEMIIGAQNCLVWAEASIKQERLDKASAELSNAREYINELRLVGEIPYNILSSLKNQLKKLQARV